jgi:NADH-quinone oxidoreductase subunit C
MTPRLQKLFDTLQQAGLAPVERLGEITVEVPPAAYLETCRKLRDSAELRFEQVIDLCGVDYSTYGGARAPRGGRFAVVLHLLSVTHNWRLRVRCMIADEELPMLPSLVEVWPSVNWFEREAFDLFGFVGHPFRKDFPISGYVEMRYDPEQRRVVYQPVTIEPREITPRVVREPKYGEE